MSRRATFYHVGTPSLSYEIKATKSNCMMRKTSGRFVGLLAVLSAVVLLSCVSLAEGTKQVFCDAGLYPGTDLLLRSGVG